jgi:hypothetical protein
MSLRSNAALQGLMDRLYGIRLTLFKIRREHGRGLLILDRNVKLMVKS